MELIETNKDYYHYDLLGAYISTLCQINELQFIHKKKFGIVPLKKQRKKLFEEINEYAVYTGDEKDKKGQIEELIDIIIAAVGLCNSYNINLNEELKKKLKKIASATYKNNHHVGEYK